jgi:putative transposase
VAVIQEAYVKGVSTRKVDDLVRSLGASGVSKSEVSRLVTELDVDLAAFRERRLEGTRYPYLWLDAQYEKVRDGGRIVNAAFLVAIAANERGEREVVGCAVAAAESEASWTAFLRSLVARGLGGVRLVTSDAHLGIRAAVGATLDGAAWQRSSVHLFG